MKLKRLTILVLFGAMCLGSAGPDLSDSAAITAGRAHVSLAKLLSDDGLRFDSDDLSWLGTYDEACSDLVVGIEQDASQVSPTPSTDGQKRILTNYLNLYCKAGGELWFKAFYPCLHGGTEPWCDDPELRYDHIKLDDYFQELVGTMESTHSPLERHNIMVILLDIFSAHQATELPERRIEKWYARATASYVQSASFEDVATVVHHFQDSWVGLMPGVVDVLKEYTRNTPGLSAAQRKKINKLLPKRFTDDG